MRTFLTVKFALIPFATFWALLAVHRPILAIGGAIAISAIGNIWNASKHKVFVLEAGGLALFALIAIGEFLAPGWAERNALWASLAGLGAISFLSLAIRRPWTAEYSRAAYPDSADAPQFRAINWALTAFWGCLFSILAACRYFGVSDAITTGLVLFGASISIVGPRLGIAYLVNRLRASQETFRWPLSALVLNGRADCDVAVIGAGIGGLTAAALLADSGQKVEVFEHHVLAGGYCHNYLRKARYNGQPVVYRFDAGPHDFSGVWPGGPITGLLQRLRIADRVHWERVDHTYRLPGGSIEVPRDWQAYARLIGEQFPGDADGIATLFRDIHAIFEGMYATGHGRTNIPGLPATNVKLLAFRSQHPTAARWMDRPFEELVALHVKDDRVIGLVNALSGYLGDGSERLTCAQMVPIFGYYFKGGHYPIGGSGHFADVLAEAIMVRGGRVHLKAPVARILVEDGRTTGVVLADGRTVRAQAVVSNADMKRTFLELLDPATLPRTFRTQIADAPPANSAFSVHLGIDFVPNLSPATHISSPMHVGVAIMSKLDPSAAPKGHATLMLISLLPFDEARLWFPETGGEGWREWRRSDEYEGRKSALGDRMIAAAETIIPDLSKHIVYRADASPVTYARYDWSSSGAIYGIARGGRLKGSKSPVPGLVIAGSGNAGAGVEAAVISGASAAETLVPGLLERSPRPVPLRS